MEGIILGIIILIFSAILHEIAHGWVAEKLGDPTARIAGRLTLNPLPHIDPIMSVAVPILMYFLSQGAFIFAAAKPVPVNPLMLRDGRKDVALVALSGPITNILIAIIVAVLGKVFIPMIPEIENTINMVVTFNLLLGFLNLIPIPPLDGSKFFSILMPEKTAQQYLSLAPFGLFILFFFLFSTGLGDILNNLIQNSLRLLGM